MDRDVVHQQLVSSVRHMLQAHEREVRLRDNLTQERLLGSHARLTAEERERLEKALATAGTTLNATIHEFCDQLIDAVAHPSTHSAPERAGV